MCIDRSALSDACLQYAVAISKSLGSAMTLLHVMQPPHERPRVHATDTLDWEISRQDAGSYIERLEREGTMASGRHVDTRLEQGHPAERITAVARDLDADLTVLGSHGERGAAAWNLGSAALQVLAVRLVDLSPSPMARALERARKFLSSSQFEDAKLQKAAEWFLDNYYFIRRVARHVMQDLPLGFLRRLPELVSGPAKEVPRIDALARALVRRGPRN